MNRQACKSNPIQDDCLIDELWWENDVEIRRAQIRECAVRMGDMNPNVTASARPLRGTLLQQLSYGTTMISIPFPNLLNTGKSGRAVSERFTFIKQGATGSVRYFPRAEFASFVDFMDKTMRKMVFEIDIRGVIGGGKSHILLAYAFYMMALRFENVAGIPRVIYIHDCRTPQQKIFSIVRAALALAFPESRAVLEKLKDLSGAADFIGEQLSKGEKILFIYDNWNFYGDSCIDLRDDGILRTRDALLALAGGNLTLYGICSHSESKISMSARDSRPHQYHIGGLSESEWDTWKANFFPEIVESFRARAQSPVEAKEKEDRCKYMTGLIPLVIQQAADIIRHTTGEADSDDVISTLISSQDGNPMNSAWIKSCLESHYSRLHPRHVDAYVDLMTRAVGGLETDNSPLPALYDARFFTISRVKGRSILRPSCGIVKVVLVQLLSVVEEDRVRCRFNVSWAARALSFPLDSNPSVLGFVFEQFALFNLHTYLWKAIGMKPPKQPKLNIHHFDDDYPRIDDELTSATGEPCVHFWPNKWNSRYVHSVVRLTRTEMRDVPIASLTSSVSSTDSEMDADASGGDVRITRSTGKRPLATPAGGGTVKKQKVKTEKVSVRCVDLIFIHVTLNDPSAHGNSSEVFTKPHMDTDDSTTMPDWQRYVHPHDDVQHVNKYLLWVVPARAANKTTPADPPHGGFKQYMHELQY